jgi:hypothetical protein
MLLTTDYDLKQGLRVNGASNFDIYTAGELLQVLPAPIWPAFTGQPRPGSERLHSRPKDVDAQGAGEASGLVLSTTYTASTLNGLSPAMTSWIAPAGIW